ILRLGASPELLHAPPQLHELLHLLADGAVLRSDLLLELTVEMLPVRDLIPEFGHLRGRSRGRPPLGGGLDLPFGLHRSSFSLRRGRPLRPACPSRLSLLPPSLRHSPSSSNTRRDLPCSQFIFQPVGTYYTGPLVSTHLRDRGSTPQKAGADHREEIHTGGRDETRPIAPPGAFGRRPTGIARCIRLLGAWG